MKKLILYSIITLSSFAALADSFCEVVDCTISGNINFIITSWQIHHKNIKTQQNNLKTLKAQAIAHNKDAERLINEVQYGGGEFTQKLHTFFQNAQKLNAPRSNSTLNVLNPQPRLATESEFLCLVRSSPPQWSNPDQEFDRYQEWVVNYPLEIYLWELKRNEKIMQACLK